MIVNHCLDCLKHNYLHIFNNAMLLLYHKKASNGIRVGVLPCNLRLDQQR